MSTSTPETTKQPWLPPKWFIHFAWRFHRGLYRITGGRFGLRPPSGDKYGMMRVTATGRKSGEPRAVILAYYRDDENLVTLAMNGWDAPDPAWWLNLQANPVATVDLDDETVTVRAREAEGDERTRLWERWRDYDPKLDGMAARRPTETAVVVLEPMSGASR
jgi:F420H(2)-dependent quinone reductase